MKNLFHSAFGAEDSARFVFKEVFEPKEGVVSNPEEELLTLGKEIMAESKEEAPEETMVILKGNSKSGEEVDISDPEQTCKAKELTSISISWLPAKEIKEEKINYRIWRKGRDGWWGLVKGYDNWKTQILSHGNGIIEPDSERYKFKKGNYHLEVMGYKGDELQLVEKTFYLK